MRKFLASLYCILLCSSVFLFMYGQRFPLVKPTFASLSDVNKTLNAPIGNVYFLYTNDSGLDVVSSKVFMNLCKVLPQHEYHYRLGDDLVDSSGLVLPQVVGAGKYLVFFGGPSAQPCVSYYESSGEAPLVFRENATHFWWESREGDFIEEACVSRLEFDEYHDIFVLEFFFDRFGRGVFIAYGYGRWGTRLAGIYFRDVVFPRLSEYTSAYYVFKWFDVNGDGFPGVDEIVSALAKYVCVQAAIHRSEVVDSGILGWYANACHSRGLRVTWYVNPVNLSAIIVRMLKGYAALGDDIELSFGNVFFNEMEPEQRLVRVDSYIAAFKNIFGLDPVLVEAYYIDAYTLDYIDAHYPSVNGCVGYVDHEVFCDGFKSAGAYYMPYYPSKYNTLVPNNSSEEKLDFVMLPFIHRDVTNCVTKRSVLYSLNPQDGYTTVENWRLYFFRLLCAFIDGWDHFGLALYLIDLSYSFVPTKVIEEDLDYIRDVVQWKKCSNVLDSVFVEWFRSKFIMSPHYRWVYRDPILESFSSVWYFTPVGRTGYIDGRLFESSSFVRNYEECFDSAIHPYDDSMPSSG